MCALILQIMWLLMSFISRYTVPDSCPALSLSNGKVTYSKDENGVRYYVGTKATFSCNSGYSRSGSSSRTCQSSGNWNGQTPTCNESKYKLRAKVKNWYLSTQFYIHEVTLSSSSAGGDCFPSTAKVESENGKSFLLLFTNHLYVLLRQRHLSTQFCMRGVIQKK